MRRAARSSEAATTSKEIEQARIIARAFASGEWWLAERLAQCQGARLWRTPSGRYQCRSAACHACRRAAITRWWRAIVSAWAGNHSTAIELSALSWAAEGAPAAQLRRRLRDWRDGLARLDPRFASVGIAGFQMADRAMLLVQHSGVERGALLNAVAPKWCAQVISVDGVFDTTLDETFALRVGRLRRGVEPMRAFVMPQRASFFSQQRDEEPMPACW